MKLAIHQYIRGKPETRIIEHKPTHWMGDRRVNLGYDWFNIDASWPDVFEVITTMGCASSAELQGTHRHDDDFVSRQLMFIDIDSGMTIPELLTNDFYNEHGAGFYTTPSHTMDNHRFRIMFVTETPIQDGERVKKLIMALMRVFDHADPACKDSTRIFYGTVNAELKERRDTILSDAMVEVLVAMEDMFRVEQQPAPTNFNPANYTPKTVDEITVLLNELRKHYSDLEHHDRLSVVWAVMSEGISAADTVALMRQRWSDSDKTRKYESMVAGHKTNDIRLGRIYHMIRKYDADYARPKTHVFDSNTGSKIYTGIEAITILQQERYKMKGIIKNG
jgi:hypothetical protein